LIEEAVEQLPNGQFSLEEVAWFTLNEQNCCGYYRNKQIEHRIPIRLKLIESEIL